MSYTVDIVAVPIPLDAEVYEFRDRLLDAQAERLAVAGAPIMEA